MFGLFKILQQRSPYFILLLIVIGVVNSFCYFGVLYIINKTITFRPLPYFQEYNWLVFLFVLVLSFVTTALFQRYLMKLSTDLSYEFMMDVLNKTRDASVAGFEKVGNERIYAAIDDANNISTFPIQMISIVNSIIIIFCGIGLMLTESLFQTLIVFGVMTCLMVIYLIRNVSIEKELSGIRDLENSFFRYLNDLLRGFREIKMSSARRRNLVDERISKNRLDSRDGRIRTALKYLSNDLTGTYSWYIVIGVLLFGVSRVSDSGVSGAVSFTFTLLFIMGPITYVIRSIPTLTTIKVAYGRLNQLRSDLAHVPELNTGGKLASDDEERFQSLSFQGVTYAYDDSNSFELGPIDISFTMGEVVFITGANGSGKSTFTNLVAGTLRPRSGSILYNGKNVDTTSSVYRDRIAALFTDPYLFAHNYEDYAYRSKKEQIDQYASLVRLEKVLKVDYDRDSINTDLSKGQKKRVALVLALLETRPIILMDEWAAEQDPEFREYFYRSVVPALKQMGKTVILITHHDQYFEVADRLIKFESGKAFFI